MTPGSSRSWRHARGMLALAVCLTVNALCLYPRWESYLVLSGAVASLLGAAIAASRG